VLSVLVLTTRRVLSYGHHPWTPCVDQFLSSWLERGASPERNFSGTTRFTGERFRNAGPGTCDDGSMDELDLSPFEERNVLGGPLQECGTDPMTGFFRDGCCSTGPEDLGSHTICAVVTAEFLAHQRSIGNDLSTPMPQYRFPGLVPGDRWCVTARNWLRAHEDGAAAHVMLASTNARVLDIVALEVLAPYAVDVPNDASALDADD